MTDQDHSEMLRNMGTPELLRWIADLKPGCFDRLLAEHGLQTRLSKGSRIRAWVALLLSVLSLLVSLSAVMFSR